MKKKNTIKRKDEFTKIIKARNYVAEQTLTFYYIPRKEEESRIGITVTNKLGNAVVRNRAKRQVREMIKTIFDWQEDFDAVIIIRENFKNANYWDTKSAWKAVTKRLK